MQKPFSRWESPEAYYAFFVGALRKFKWKLNWPMIQYDKTETNTLKEQAAFSYMNIGWLQIKYLTFEII